MEGKSEKTGKMNQAVAIRKLTICMTAVLLMILMAFTLVSCGGEKIKLSDGGKLAVADTGSEEVNELCDQVLVEIIKKDMDERERAYAIYTWVEEEIRYSGVTMKGDFLRGAKVALAKRKGDCYAFCTALRALLMRAGFETEEVPGYQNYHFWVMVKVDGNWYHIDATTGWGGERFLLTTAELEAYSYQNPKYTNPLTYEWDKSKLPETP